MEHILLRGTATCQLEICRSRETMSGSPQTHIAIENMNFGPSESSLRDDSDGANITPQLPTDQISCADIDSLPSESMQAQEDALNELLGEDQAIGSEEEAEQRMAPFHPLPTQPNATPQSQVTADAARSRSRARCARRTCRRIASAHDLARCRRAGSCNNSRSIRTSIPIHISQYCNDLVAY